VVAHPAAHQVLFNEKTIEISPKLGKIMQSFSGRDHQGQGV